MHGSAREEVGTARKGRWLLRCHGADSPTGECRVKSGVVPPPSPAGQGMARCRGERMQVFAGSGVCWAASCRSRASGWLICLKQPSPKGDPPCMGGQSRASMTGAKAGQEKDFCLSGKQRQAIAAPGPAQPCTQGAFCPRGEESKHPAKASPRAERGLHASCEDVKCNRDMQEGHRVQSRRE